MEKAYKHLGYFLLLFIPLVFVAFYKSYIIKFPNFAINYDVFIHVHAFFASIWVLMLIVQPFLIVNKKMAWHRKIGKLSYIIFPLLILSFIPGISKIINSGNYKNLFFPIGDCILLITFYSLAIFYRKTASKHMRFMIASSLVLLGPTIGRIGPTFLGLGDVGTQNLQYGIAFSILISLISFDITNKRNYTPYSISVGGFVLHSAIFYLLFI